MIIDIFSKFGWIVPLENKKGEIVAKAFNKKIEFQNTCGLTKGKNL